VALLSLGAGFVACGSSGGAAGPGADDGGAGGGDDGASAGGAGGQGRSATGAGGEGMSGPGEQGAGGASSGAGGAFGEGGGDGNETISDAFVDDVEMSALDFARTVLEVTWTQTMPAEQTWLEFTFEAGSVMTSPPKSGEAGSQREVVLGVPGETDVTVRIVSSQDGTEYKTSNYVGTTGAVPSGMPTPEVVSYDAALASDDRWLFGAVEDSDGGEASRDVYYHTTSWLYIMDRRGRIVWYYADPASNATSAFQRIARDGEYIWIEKHQFAGSVDAEVLKMTLDREYMEVVPVPGLGDCIDVTNDGGLLYDANFELRERSRSGDDRFIWSCPEHFGGAFNCYTNTVNWNERDDTVLMSYPYEATVVEVERESGDLLGVYGAASGSYAFSPNTWEFEFQHFPNITSEGTLLLSSHMPGYGNTETPEAGQHAFMEFELDRDNETLNYLWHYQEGEEWPMFKGMAMRLPNGNTLANYGTGGAIREITPDKRTAFHVKFDVEGGDDFFNKMVGHNVLIDDLYALNGGGP
jgi:hypothetical protein